MAELAKTLQHNVTLPAGTYSIGLATATGGFNINYFTITNNLSIAKLAAPQEEIMAEEEDTNFIVSPNPGERSTAYP